MTSWQSIRPHIEPDQKKARDSWDRLNNSSIARSPFTEWSFLFELSKAFGWKLKTVFWGDVLGVCFFIRRRALASDIVVPPFTPYSAIALSSDVPEDQRKDLLGRIFDQVKGLPSSRLVSFEPRLARYASLADGYELRTRNTFWVSCNRAHEHTASYSESTRRVLKKAAGDYQISSDSLPLDQVASFVTDGYRSHGRNAPLNTDRLASLANAIGTKPYAKHIGAVSASSGTLEAGVVFLFHGQTAWYWFAGSQRGPAMTVLIDASLQELHEMGITMLDFMGANTPGITEFKRRFGGDLVPYTHVSKQSRFNQLISQLSLLLRQT